MLEKVTNRIYYLMNNDEIDRPTLGLVIGDNCCLVIDAGDSPEHAKLMQEEIKCLELPPVRYVVATHHHSDHIFGLSKWDAVTIASKQTSESVHEQYGRDGWDYRKFDLLFQGEFLIDLGGCSCIIREIVNPHRKDGTIIYVPEEKTLFLGDAAYGRNMNGHNFYERLSVFQMMQEVDSYDSEFYICSHESMCTKEEMISYFEQIKMGADITKNCETKEEAIGAFIEKYEKEPSKEEIFFLESFYY